MHATRHLPDRTDFPALRRARLSTLHRSSEIESPFGIRFDQHFALTNMPIQRFGSTLVSKGTFQSYMQSLKSACLPENLDTVMCNSMVSIDGQGALHDCDFNPMVGLRAQLNSSPKPHLRDLLAPDAVDAPIRVADHCHGCTSLECSSCGGALDEAHATSTAAASP